MDSGFREKHIEIASFGIHVDYQGQPLASGELCADHLLATVVAEALGHKDSTGGMPVTLACHVDNEKGLRFWKRHHFEKVKDVEQQAKDSPNSRYQRMVLGRRSDDQGASTG